MPCDVVGVDEVMQALDHDFNCDYITPSVNLLVALGPSGAIDSTTYYNGDVYVTLKDATLQPSSPLRHAAETLASIRHAGHQDCKVLIFKTDGGPDRNVTFLSTKVILLALARLLDVDCLVAQRTTPGQSYVNPVERVMSLLNLALYGVALDRGDCGEGTEALLKNAGSMTARRAALSKADDAAQSKTHSTAFAESMKVCRFT
jgi:hypothetical protein